MSERGLGIALKIGLVAALIATVFGCVTFWRIQRLRRDADVWHEQQRAFRDACTDNYLSSEPATSRVVVFRRACKRLGVWAGPEAMP